MSIKMLYREKNKIKAKSTEDISENQTSWSAELELELAAVELQNIHFIRTPIFPI